MKITFDLDYAHRVCNMSAYKYNPRVNLYQKIGIIESEGLVWFYEMEGFSDLRVFIFNEKERQDRNWYLPFFIEDCPVYIKLVI